MTFCQVCGRQLVNEKCPRHGEKITPKRIEKKHYTGSNGGFSKYRQESGEFQAKW